MGKIGNNCRYFRKVAATRLHALRAWTTVFVDPVFKKRPASLPNRMDKEKREKHKTNMKGIDCWKEKVVEKIGTVIHTSTDTMHQNLSETEILLLSGYRNFSDFCSYSFS